MRNKGAIWLLAILLTLVCVYQLWFTVVTNGVQKDAKEYAKGDPVKEEYYLDSVGSEVVFNALVKKYNYRECQQRELNFGLDLKGGMNIILEISTVDILKSLSADPGNPLLIQAIDRAKELQQNSPAGFIDLFGQAFDEVAPDASLETLFRTPELSGRIDYGTSNSDVIDILNEEAKGAIDNAFNIITTRIDQFGVAQPNIQRLESGDRILVDLPGVKNKDRVRKLLQGTAHLEFWETYDNRTTTMQNGLMRANEVIKEYLEAEKAKASSQITEEVAEEEVQPEVVTEEPVAEEAETEVAADGAESLLAEIAAEDSTGTDSLEVGTQMENYPLFQVLYPRVSREEGRPFPGGIIGTAHYRDTAKVNKYLKIAKQKNAFPRDVKFLWDANPIKDQQTKKRTDFFELYAIKTKGRSRAPLEGDVITSAREDFDETKGYAMVNMNMNGEGAKIWKVMTGQNIDSMVCVVMDNRVYSGATVQGEIPNGSTQITGQFTISEAQDLANLLKSGKLPAPARIINETVVGPSLGKKSVENGLNSFLIAFVVILLYMVFYYSHKAGLIANIALIANMFFIFGVLASLGAALTLPGIAGIVLTIGMSVDANVLIFERVREELTAGKGLKLAIQDGYKNALSAIIDANITTFITGVILLLLGTGPIKGFATTLVIGICTSLFTALLVSRLIIEIYLKKNKKVTFDTKVTRGAFKGMKVRFIEKRKVAYVISTILVLIGIASLATRGLDQGVDFTGGRNYIIKFDTQVDNQEVAKLLAEPFQKEPKVIMFGGEEQVRITTRFKIDEEGTEVESEIQDLLYNTLSPLLKEKVDAKVFVEENIQSSQKVGPTIADDIKRKAVWAILVALLFMFLYIIIRFRNWQFGLGAVLALVHDSLIVLGIYSLLYGIMPFSLEIDQAFVAAILTVVGYSINDTVVVFDRIREYIREFPKRERTEIMDLALNSTLSRTFSTSLSTLVVLLTIFFFGGEVIQGFIFALVIGVLVGTYSSLFIATPVVFDTIKKSETTRVLKGKRRS
ncbi:MAG: protein translocase subunit SecDF [Bacteroidales bacterium]|nr:protein translocase subunit SecDF [Bacteroidales bacterium]